MLLVLGSSIYGPALLGSAKKTGITVGIPLFFNPIHTRHEFLNIAAFPLLLTIALHVTFEVSVRITVKYREKKDQRQHRQLTIQRSAILNH